jgi:hypothetical protein
LQFIVVLAMNLKPIHMKTIKLLLLLLAFSTITFYSCSDENPIKNNIAATQKSIALRTSLNEIKKANDINGKATATGKTLTNPFCFEFVYPLSLSFNNGTVVTVSSFQGLLNVLSSENPNFYLEGIFFPFQVAYLGSLHTISSESDFVDLLVMCGFNTLHVDLHNTFCFDFVFPIAIFHGDDVIQVFESAEELNTYLSDPNNGSESNLVFPVSVLYEGQVVVINNLYEFYDMVNNCNSCICSQEYAPVCVQTANGIVEYGNFCQAQCAGFTQNDLVPCNPSQPCDLGNLNVTFGGCEPNGARQTTINFTYGTHPANTQFNVRNVIGQIQGTYTLSQLPVTVPYFTGTDATGDYLTISIIGEPNCQITNTNETPPCGGCNCPANIDPVCVQTVTGVVQYTNPCFAICAGHSASEFITCGVAPNNFGTQLGSCFHLNYPVEIQAQGAIILAQNDGEVLQYWFPASGQIMPQFNYPITVTFANSNYTFANQAAFEAIISTTCH